MCEIRLQTSFIWGGQGSDTNRKDVWDKTSNFFYFCGEGVWHKTIWIFFFYPTCNFLDGPLPYVSWQQHLVHVIIPKDKSTNEQHKHDAILSPMNWYCSKLPEHVILMDELCEFTDRVHFWLKNWSSIDMTTQSVLPYMTIMVGLVEVVDIWLPTYRYT